MLTDEELLRYSRQVLLAEVDVAGQLKLKQSRVLIIGMGGLGAPVALYLAAAGVGQLILADFDQVDLTNLQRQVIYSTDQLKQQKVIAAKQRLMALNPAIAIETVVEAINEDNISGLFEQADIVLDCTDNFLIRDLINRTSVLKKKAVISGAAIRLQGQITAFDPNQKTSPCYHCLYGEGGDEQLTCSEAGVLGPMVGVIGSMQALETIKLLLSFGRSLVGRLIIFNGLNSEFRELKVLKDPACKVCGEQYGK
ncbi:HesA/MoeB/ThiF family protein [Entomomonas asaccharolytica]|uniref:Molybdopterin-synthase adenylyltransferase n=1 Tax=Entomomonas asaccharolytica TaxID=2785331 RepID=A0A974NHV5_9GAMM|nr:molybdopterin-synthase adenylyltransferase MoeB [Entomomonas asaccharolytica]QQP87120.1 molybdopterin-synthase adenylyltransferase MoeB [Entomomonas asaccharolytica]